MVVGGEENSERSEEEQMPSPSFFAISDTTCCVYIHRALVSATIKGQLADPIVQVGVARFSARIVQDSNRRQECSTTVAKGKKRGEQSALADGCWMQLVLLDDPTQARSISRITVYLYRSNCFVYSLSSGVSGLMSSMILLAATRRRLNGSVAARSAGSTYAPGFREMQLNERSSLAGRQPRALLPASVWEEKS
jgi:hypothetical protein